MDLADKLAEYVASLTFDDLGEDTIHVAKQRIVDTVGCALGAVDSQPVNAIRAYVSSLATGPSRVFFSDLKVAPEAAAFLNATMVRYLDYNDGYFALEPGHSSDNIPACLAVAQAEGLGGRDVILAMVVAYEVQMRLQDVSCLFRRGWDHVNFVTVSATLAVGKLLGLSQQELIHALGMALNGHIAMRQVRSGELSGWKGASAANASRNAIVCCYLARHGMTGPGRIFEGDMGFFAQVSGKFSLDVAAFGNGDNQDFHIKRAKTKLYPTNGEMQTAVMATIALREQIDNLEDIAKIEVDTTDVGYKFLAKDRAKWRPMTRETADHSLPFTVARALLDGTITRATYDEADFSDPVVLALMDKIAVREDPELTAQMPSLANRVSITMTDGRILSDEHGTITNPRIGLKDSEIETKFSYFASGRFSDSASRRLLDIVWRFDDLPRIDDFMAAMNLSDSAIEPVLA